MKPPRVLVVSMSKRANEKSTEAKPQSQSEAKNKLFKATPITDAQKRSQCVQFLTRCKSGFFRKLTEVEQKEASDGLKNYNDN